MTIHRSTDVSIKGEREGERERERMQFCSNFLIPR